MKQEDKIVFIDGLVTKMVSFVLYLTARQNILVLYRESVENGRGIRGKTFIQLYGNEFIFLYLLPCR